MAIDRDDLSLLTAATLKERARFGAKGISTITRLLVRLPSSAAQAYQSWWRPILKIQPTPPADGQERSQPQSSSD